MTCDEFLERYSEYLDDRMPLPEAARWRAHVRDCASCARYHRVLERGREAVRELPRIAPSAEFDMRLRQRLAEVDRELEEARRDSRPSTLAALSIAALLALVAWSPVLQERAESPEVELPAMQARAPLPRVAPTVPRIAPLGAASRRPAALWNPGAARGTQNIYMPRPEHVRTPSFGRIGVDRAPARLFFDAPALLRTDPTDLGLSRVRLPSPGR